METSLWITICIALFSAVVSVTVSVYQNRATRKNRIAVMKEKWMSEFRTTVVELLTALDNIFFQKYKSYLIPEGGTITMANEVDLAKNHDYRQARLLRYRLELMLNRNNNKLFLEKVDNYMDTYLKALSKEHYTQDNKDKINTMKKELMNWVEHKLSSTWDEIRKV